MKFPQPVMIWGTVLSAGVLGGWSTVFHRVQSQRKICQVLDNVSIFQQAV